MIVPSHATGKVGLSVFLHVTGNIEHTQPYITTDKSFLETLLNSDCPIFMILTFLVNYKMLRLCFAGQSWQHAVVILKPCSVEGYEKVWTVMSISETVYIQRYCCCYPTLILYAVFFILTFKHFKWLNNAVGFNMLYKSVVLCEKTAACT